MTLHCNKVKLWPCPEWVAKMCIHGLDDLREEVILDWCKIALERYLIWAEESHPVYVRDAYGFNKHKQEVLEAIKAPDLKVWME